jgi:hypothetical protein
MITRKEIQRKELPRKEVGETKAGDPTTTWDVPEEGQSKRRHMHLGAGAGAGAWALSDRFDRVLPPHKRYLGRSRRTFLVAVLIAFVCVLALIIGLAVGLSNKSK